MKIVSTSYSKTEEFSSPEKWLERISFYTVILDELAKKNDVISIERINYQGALNRNRVHYEFILLEKQVERFPYRLHKFIRDAKPDVVLVNGFIFPLQIIQLRLYIGRKPKIMVLHRAERPFTGFKKILQQIADKSVNAYLFASAEFGKEWLQKGNLRDDRKIFEALQASSLFSGIDKQVARARLDLNNDVIYLWVGRLDNNKDPLTVVQAFIDFSTSHPSAKLYMIYQTQELLNDVKKCIEQHNKQEHILLVGKKDHHELELWYSSADFIISGSHYEGSGIAVIEAMSCGCIPVVTDIISFRKITENNCGFIYEPGNVKDLYSALNNSIATNKDLLSKRVKQRFEKEYSPAAVANKIESIAALMHK